MINSGANVTISGLTIANCISSLGTGGGIYNAATLTVSNCTISNNVASRAGGGVYNAATLTVTNSTFSGNYAAQGGGVYTEGALSTLTVTNSTFTGNTATEYIGGGIVELAGVLAVSNSTISGNTASYSGGGIFNGSTLTLLNSIVAGNTTGGTLGSDDCVGCGTQSSSNMIGGAPQLGSLAANGGPTQTMLPLPGSPAICAGLPSLNPVGLSTDQRGFPRLNVSYLSSTGGTCLDLGGVQTNYQSVQFTNAGSGYSAIVNQDASPAPIVSVAENGQNIGQVPITLSFSGTGAASGLGPVATTAGMGAQFGSLSVNTAGTDTLSATLQITPTGVTPAFSITTNPSNNATLTVSLPTLTITASSATITYGSAVPPVTPSYMGFVNGDSPSSLRTRPTCSTQGLPSAPPAPPGPPPPPGPPGASSTPATTGHLCPGGWLHHELLWGRRSQLHHRLHARQPDHQSGASDHYRQQQVRSPGPTDSAAGCQVQQLPPWPGTGQPDRQAELHHHGDEGQSGGAIPDNVLRSVLTRLCDYLRSRHTDHNGSATTTTTAAATVTTQTLMLGMTCRITWSSYENAWFPAYPPG